MLTANVFSSLIIFAAAVFPILNISTSFLNPSVGFSLTKSKNLTFSSRERFSFASLASVCDVYYALAGLVDSVLEVILHK